MAEINFPDSPTNGQVFASGGLSWTYSTGVGWLLNSDSGFPGGGDSFELLQVGSTGARGWKAPESWWTYKLVAGASPANAGEFTADNTSFPSELKFHITDSSTRNRTDDLRRLAVGDVIHIVGLSATGSWRTMVTAAPALSGSIVTIKVANIAGTSTGFGSEWTMGTNGYHRFEPQYAGSSAAQLPAKAFAANFGGGSIPAQTTTFLYVGAQTIADGFVVVNNTEIVAQQDMRVKATAMLSIVGTAGSWATITLVHRRNEANVRNWDVVWNNSGPFRGTAVDAVIDMLAGDSIRIGITPDVAGASVDGRSWVNVVQVANPYSAVLPSPWNSAWGVVASVKSETSQTGIGAVTDVTGLSTTFTPVAGRRYRVSAFLLAFKSATTSHTNAYITNASNGVLQQSVDWSTVSTFMTHEPDVILEGLAATPLTLKVRLGAEIGTVNTQLNAGSPGLLTVEDIGPVSGAVAVPNPTPAWITPTLINGWTNFGSGFQTVQYRKIGDQVYLRGLLKVPASPTPSDAFNLLVGYFPPAIVVFATLADGTTSNGRLDINTTGGVRVQSGWSGAGGFVSLDGVQFSTTP